MIFIDFHGFLAWVFENGKRQLAAPIESFARFQVFHRFLWICMISIDFHGFFAQAGFLSSEAFHRIL